MRTFLFGTVLILIIASPGNRSTAQGQKPFVRSRDASNIAQKLATDHLVGNFKPSLEMKECTDFLLTPALIVQEILSENVVVTYPSE